MNVEIYKNNLHYIICSVIFANAVIKHVLSG